MKQISKTILILAICIWAGIGTNILHATESRRISRAELKAQQHWPSSNHSMQRVHIMNDKDFQFLYKVIKKKSFEKDQLELLSIGVLDNHFSCQQCLQLMSLFTFDKDKFKILKIMANHIADLENVDSILDTFKFDSDKRKAANMLKIHRR